MLYLILLCVAGCGGTWVDDPGNFKRVFGFNLPDDVRVLHSYYWRSPHWTTEYSYFIAVQPSSKFVSGLTANQFMTVVNPDHKLLKSCGPRPPVVSAQACGILRGMASEDPDWVSSFPR